MTYLDNEEAGVKPIEGFHFFYENEEWLFTPEPKATTIGSLVFESEPSSRSSLTSSGEQGSNEAEVTIRRSHPMIVRFETMDKNSPFRCVVYRGHLGGAVDEYARIFSGDISQVEFKGELATVTIISIRHRFERQVPRYLYQAQCNHQTYGRLCGLDRDDWTFPSTLGDSGPYWGIEGRIASTEISAKPVGFYDGGVVTWVDPATGIEHKRQIYGSSSSGFFYVRDPFPASFDPPTGLEVTLTAGDDHSYETCHTKFSNTPNYGGFPFKSLRDPRHGIL